MGRAGREELLEHGSSRSPRPRRESEREAPERSRRRCECMHQTHSPGRTPTESGAPHEATRGLVRRKITRRRMHACGQRVTATVSRISDWPVSRMSLNPGTGREARDLLSRLRHSLLKRQGQVAAEAIVSIVRQADSGLSDDVELGLVIAGMQAALNTLRVMLHAPRPPTSSTSPDRQRYMPQSSQQVRGPPTASPLSPNKNGQCAHGSEFSYGWRGGPMAQSEEEYAEWTDDDEEEGEEEEGEEEEGEEEEESGGEDDAVEDEGGGGGGGGGDRELVPVGGAELQGAFTQGDGLMAAKVRRQRAAAEGQSATCGCRRPAEWRPEGGSPPMAPPPSSQLQGGRASSPRCPRAVAQSPARPTSAPRRGQRSPHRSSPRCASPRDGWPASGCRREAQSSPQQQCRDAIHSAGFSPSLECASTSRSVSPHEPAYGSVSTCRYGRERAYSPSRSGASASSARSGARSPVGAPPRRSPTPPAPKTSVKTSAKTRATARATARARSVSIASVRRAALPARPRRARLRPIAPRSHPEHPAACSAQGLPEAPRPHAGARRHRRGRAGTSRAPTRGPHRRGPRRATAAAPPVESVRPPRWTPSEPWSFDRCAAPVARGWSDGRRTAAHHPGLMRLSCATGSQERLVTCRGEGSRAVRSARRD